MRLTLHSIFILVINICILNTSYTLAQNGPQPKLNGGNIFIKLPAQALSAKPTPQLLSEYLKVDESNTFHKLGIQSDLPGISQEKYQQYYKGIPVEYSIYKIHAKNGMPQAITGEQYTALNIDIKPALSETEALKKALQFVNANIYKWEVSSEEKWMQTQNDGATYFPTGELVICKVFINGKKGSSDEMALAYKFDIYAEEPLSRAYIYVDAHNGSVIHQNAVIKHASGAADTRYSGARTINTDQSGNTYRLHDLSRGTGIETYNLQQRTTYSTAIDFTDNDNNWTSVEYANTQKDNAALDAHWGAMMTYDYFKNEHNRNSFDGNGGKIKNYVHYSTNYINAFWNGSVMTYGDGGRLGNITVQPLTALDVTAHEIGHAVCEHTANLVYAYESGALNEAFSDIWGATVENYVAPGKSPWTIGEDMNYTIRSMINPNEFEHPDTYLGKYWYTGNADNGGVHINSGVLNYWYYLLCTGKTGVNDNGDSYQVTGIGISKAAKIAFRTESVYLTANSQYADACRFSIQAAIDLYGAGSVEAIQTANAWYAVGVYNTESAPSILTATTATTTQINLSWVDNSTSETGFRIERSVTAGSGFVQIATVGANIVSYQDKNLPTDAIYHYRVTAIIGTIRSAYSNIASATVGNGPIIMSNATVSTCNAVFLDPGGHNDYQNHLNMLMTFTPGVAGNKISVNFSVFNIEYWYDNLKVYDGASVSAPLIGKYSGNTLPSVLTATNATGQLTFQFISDGSNTYSGWVANVSCVVIPVTPSSLTATAITTTQINLSWVDNSTSETGFRIERSVTAGSGFVQVATVGANIVSYQDKNLLTDAIYYYRVRAEQGNIFSAFSNETNAIVGTLPIVMNNTSITLCQGTLLDPGGKDNYSNYLNMVMTLTPGTADNKMRISFSSFSTEPGYDYLRVYDGTSVNAPLLGNYSGNTLPPVLTATNATGQLTFQFISDGSSNYFGWEAEISCINLNPLTINGFSPASGKPGDTIVITGTGFTSAASVRFHNNAIADFVVDSPTQIIATVPTTATTGPVSISTQAVNATSGSIFSVKASAQITLSNLTHLYNGISKQASVITLPANLPVTITYNGSGIAPVNAGKYIVMATINTATHQGSITDTMVINQAPVTVDVSNLIQTYDGISKQVTVITNPVGKMIHITYNGNSSLPTDAGNYTVLATVTDVNYIGSATAVFVINKAAATITLSNVTQTYNGTAKSATITTIPAGLIVNTTYNYLANAPVNAGIYTILATIMNANYTGSATHIFTINKANQSITFASPGNKKFKDEFMLTATSTAQLPVSYSVVSGTAKIVNNKVVVNSTGTIKLKAVQEGNTNYQAAAPVEQSFSADKANQTITFVPLADKTFGEAPFKISATATSDLGVEFTVVSGPATIIGNTITLTGAGKVIVKAVQEGNINYAAATPVERQFMVNLPSKSDQSITFTALLDKTFGDTPFTLDATATSKLPVTFNIVSGPATITGNVLTLTGAGKVIVKAMQTGNITFKPAKPLEQTFCVSPIKPVITQNGSDIEAIFTLTSSSLSGNQWLKNGEEIEGAIGQNYKVTQAGNYSVRVTTGDCSNTSEQLSLTGETTIEQIAGIQVYPNPTAERIFINGQTHPTTKKVVIAVFNNIGVKLLEEVVLSKNGTYQAMFEVSQLSPGNYIIRITDNQQVYTKTFVKY